MGKLGDLIVRLRLQYKDYEKGLKNADAKTKTFAGTLGKIKGVGVAVFSALTAAAVTFAREFASHTNTLGDAWQHTMTAMRASYHSVIADLSTYKPDFSSLRNFFKKEWSWIKNTIFNAKEAGDAAVEMSKAFDAEFELVNSVKLQRQQIQQELNDLYVRMRDTTLSDTDRQAAADKYKALLQPIADAEVAVYGEMLNKAVEAWQAGNNLDRQYSTQELVEFFSKIGTEYDKMAAKFPDLMRVYETRKGDATNQPIFDIIGKYQQAANQMSDIDRQLARTTNSIKASIQKNLDEIADAVKKYGSEDLELDLELDVILSDDIDWSELEKEMSANLANLQDTLHANYVEIDNLNNMLAQSLTDAFSSGMQALTDFIIGVDGANVEQVMSAYIQPIANMMRNMGEMFMFEGIAEMQLIKGGPAQKIAAGAALIAISSAISSGLSKMAGAVGGTSASVSAAGASAGTVELYEQDITIHVVGEISGDKIILAGQKTLNKWSR